MSESKRGSIDQSYEEHYRRIDELPGTNNFRLYFRTNDPGSLLAEVYDCDVSNESYFATMVGSSKAADIKAAIRQFRSENPEVFEAVSCAVDTFCSFNTLDQEAITRFDDLMLKPMLKDMVPTLLSYDVDPIDLII